MAAFAKLAATFFVISGSFASPIASPIDIVRGEPDFVLRRDNFTLARRQAPNYDQHYTTGGTVNYTPSGDSFSVNWNTQDDFVVGVGWGTGDTT